MKAKEQQEERKEKAHTGRGSFSHTVAEGVEYERVKEKVVYDVVMPSRFVRPKRKERGTKNRD